MPGQRHDIDIPIGQIMVCCWKIDHLSSAYGYVLGGPAGKANAYSLERTYGAILRQQVYTLLHSTIGPVWAIQDVTYSLSASFKT